MKLLLFCFVLFSEQQPTIQMKLNLKTFTEILKDFLRRQQGQEKLPQG